jgi:Ubiquitin carboxyl-terminal hydrolase
MTPFLEGNAWSDERASARETTTSTDNASTTDNTTAAATAASSGEAASGKHSDKSSTSSGKATDKQQQQQQQQSAQVAQLKSDNGNHVWLHQAWNETIIQLQKEHVLQQQQQLPLDTTATSLNGTQLPAQQQQQQQQQTVPPCNGSTTPQQPPQQQHTTVSDADGNLYDLFSVVIHKGNAYSGHYHAYIRDCLNEGQWCAPIPVPLDKLAEFISGTGRHSDMSVSTTSTSTASTEGNSSSKSDSDAVTVLKLVYKQLVALQRDAKCMSIKQLMKALDKDAAKYSGADSKNSSSTDSGAILNWRALALAHTAAKSSMSLDDVAVAHALLNIIKSKQDVFNVVSATNSADSGILDANTLLATTVTLLDAADAATQMSTGTSTMTRTASQESLLPTVKAKLTNHLEWSYRSSYGLLHVDEVDDTSTSTDGTAPTVTADSKHADTAATATATTAVNGVSGAHNDGSRHDDDDDMMPLHIDVETAVSQNYGKWFNFDDRSVTPISILELQKPFEGKLYVNS